MDVSIDGHDLNELAAAPPPFLTAYVNLGATRDVTERLSTAAAGLDSRRRPSEPIVAAALDAVEDRFRRTPDLLDVAQALAVMVDGRGRAWTFALADPLRFDVARFGDVPSLGGVLESSQLVPRHVVLTPALSPAEESFDLVSFGSRSQEGTGDGAVQLGLDLTGVTQALRFVEPTLLLIGEVDEPTWEAVRDIVPEARLERLDPDLDGDALADHVVRVAASHHAEVLALELGRFRAARDAGIAVEGDEVLDAVLDGRVVDLLVHDDPADHRLVGGDRLVDRVIAEALARGIVPTMIPEIVAETGPLGGLGAVSAEQPAGDRAALAEVVA